MVFYKILFDYGLIWGPVYTALTEFVRVCSQVILIDVWIEMLTFGTSKSSCSHGRIAQIDFPQISCFMDLGYNFVVFQRPWGIILCVLVP